MQDIKTITRSLFDAFNLREFDKLVALSSDKLDWLDIPTGKKFVGQEGLKQWSQMWSDAFSDSKVEVVNHFDSGELVCTEYVGRGKHTGPLNLGKQTIPPSGRTIDIRLCNVVRVQNGKIVSGHVYYDLLTLMRQLGVEQASRAAA